MEKAIVLLTTELKTDTLIDQLIKQVNKDFYRAVQEDAVPEGATIIEIVSNIETLLKKLLQLDASKITTLLYLIDVSEQEVEKNLKENPDQLVEVLSFLILKRECLKVYFRNKL